MEHPLISVIVPCYNEEYIIVDTARKLLDLLPRFAENFEIIFSNDGSTDRTEELLNELQAKYNRIKVTGYPSNRGAGYAFRKALEIASGRVIVHMDADLAIDPENVCRESIQRLRFCDVAVASRYLGTRAQYPLRRRIPSLLYRCMYRTLLGLSLQDAMSGFFGMRYSVLKKIGSMEMDGFEIYLELFSKAKRNGLKIEEYPERFVHDTRSGEVSVIATAPRQILNTFKIWWKLRGYQKQSLTR
jgi:glycosyltransferase involved in cell wall biosynthesis